MRARDEEDEEKQPAHASAHVSPAMRLYRHALETIFGMLELGDLVPVLAVSRSWSAAVRSMAPINAVCERDEWGTLRQRNAFRMLPPIASIVASPLLRHLAAIHISHTITHVVGSFTPMTNESLGLLAQHAQHLTSLRVHVNRSTYSASQADVAEPPS